MEQYKYVMLRRPFSIGTHPLQGFISYDENIGRHGVLSYDRVLTEKEMYNFELAILTDNSMIGMTKSSCFGKTEITHEVIEIVSVYQLKCKKTHISSQKVLESVLTSNDFFKQN